MERSKLFKMSFAEIRNASVQVSECGFFDASVYVNGLEFVQVVEESERYMVFINNPYCEVDENGSAIFTKEHPQQQWVFGYYKSLKRAINMAKSIVINGKYPKPIEVW